MTKRRAHALSACRDACTTALLLASVASTVAAPADDTVGGLPSSRAVMYGFLGLMVLVVVVGVALWVRQEAKTFARIASIPSKKARLAEIRAKLKVERARQAELEAKLSMSTVKSSGGPPKP